MREEARVPWTARRHPTEDAGGTLRVRPCVTLHPGAGLDRSRWTRWLPCLLALMGWVLPADAGALDLSWPPRLRFPTANSALLEAGGESRFFTPTPNREWESGSYGCVRTDAQGPRLHEGIDIRSLERDRRGESTDPVWASADGVVAYVNRRAGASSYGIYVVLGHRIDGLECYTLYAHLRDVAAGLEPGRSVSAGQVLGTLGRTSNTREAISRERAHLHFEIALLVNDRFADWYRKSHPGTVNEHGNYHGFNLLGFDPVPVLRGIYRAPAQFHLVRHLQAQPELCRVVVRQTDFDWVRRYPQLILPNPKASAEGVVAFELSLNPTGIPVRVIPRSESELASPDKVSLVFVHEETWKNHPCNRLVVRRGNTWSFTASGRQHIEQILHR